MDQGQWQRISEWLGKIWEASPEKREELISTLGDDDPELRERVEAFLSASESSSLLDRPIGSLAAELLTNDSSAEVDPDADLDVDSDVEPTTTLREGARVGHFEVRRLLGAGGMGEVFEALDTRLGRPVALKLLPPWIRSPQAKERLMREARAVSALDHPNICTLHDIGESDDGRLYLVMGYYGGETLDRIIARGPLPVEEARGIACQIARGLARAHEAGIIHRDIKPANVILTDQGEAKILDFGIARVTGEHALTATGGRPGTPAYMSPEQASGGDVGAPSDLWSLGVVLYEMLTGQRPFAGGDSQAVMHSILNRSPTPLSELRPEVPENLERAVDRSLAKDPRDRFAHAGDLLEALGEALPPQQVSKGAGPPWLWLVAIGVLLAGLWLGSNWWQAKQSKRDRQIAPTSQPATEAGELLLEAPLIAVLPFINRTGQEDLDWYGAGLAQLVSDALAPSRHLRVASIRRTQALTSLEGGGLEAAAESDGIGFVLTGEILPSPEGLQLAARIISASEQRKMDSYGEVVAEPQLLLSLADEVAVVARRALGAPLEESVDVLAADFASDNPEAYEYYLEGLVALSDYHYSIAEQAFARALEVNPTFTMALYRLAYVQAAAGRTDEALTGIRSALARAHLLPDRERRYVQAAAAYIERRFEVAIAAYREIVELYPWETEARSQLVVLLNSQGQREEQLDLLEILRRIAPEDPTVWSMAGEILLQMGQHQEALVNLQRYAILAPDSANAHDSLGNAYRAQGELALAAAEYTRALELDPAFGSATVDLAQVEAIEGNFDDAEDRLEALVRDPLALPRHRIDAAFELSALLRSGGRFAASARLLEQLEQEIAAESVREAWALSLRGDAELQQGRPSAARHLAELAVARSPTNVTTRYLYGRGLVELARGRWPELDTTIAEIQRITRSKDDPNRGAEERAAADLVGLSALAQGKVTKAIQQLELAVALSGYPYRLYRLDLARAYFVDRSLPQALATARQTLEEREFAEPRLDLELDRIRARLLLAQIHDALGNPEQASHHANAFLKRWARADAGLPDLVEARRLAQGETTP